VHHVCMTLLRFRVENHKSFRDLAELSLVPAGMKTARPTDGTWRDKTHAVAAVYGPNASGKSSLLEALDFAVEVIRNSATVWRKAKVLPHRPFRLDEHSSAAPSSYAIDFTLDDVRHEYGFSLTGQGIHSEWLYDYPVGRQRLLFERGLDDTAFRFGRALTGGTAALEKLTGVRELLLSRGANDGHPVLSRVYEALTAGFEFARFSEESRSQRLHSIVEGLTTESISVADIIVLLQVADVGIAHVEVADLEMPPEIVRVWQAVHKSLTRTQEEIDEKQLRLGLALEEVTSGLEFHHLGADGKHYTLTPADQSAGTLSWLSLAVPALEALRNGTVLLIDEIDASLHPQLAQVLIQMFKDRRLNPRGAQLVFTTHDTYFLSPSADVPLSPEEVWFVQKDRAGVSDLYSLDDFSVRQEQNLSRRYLHGRYGATPQVAPAFLEQLVSAGREGE
jgi:energy-coupling factor transporter ATP-binding protein EcfA2